MTPQQIEEQIAQLRTMRDQCKAAQIGNSDTAAFYSKAIDGYDETIIQLGWVAETLSVPELDEAYGKERSDSVV